MQFKKVLQALIITSSAMTIPACSSSKNIGNHQSSQSMLGSNTNIDPDSKVRSNLSSEEQVRLQIQQDNIVYFELDKYGISSDFFSMLDAHADFLRRNPSYKLTIEGHTDERGTPEYNISLGERRANAVKMYLQSKGVSMDQIFIISYGKEKPEVLGHNEVAYAKNRRAVLIY